MRQLRLMAKAKYMGPVTFSAPKPSRFVFITYPTNEGDEIELFDKSEIPKLIKWLEAVEKEKL